jgi:hypothetical protein
MNVTGVHSRNKTRETHKCVSRFSAISGKQEVHQRITFKCAREHKRDFVQVIVTKTSDLIWDYGQGSIFLFTQS